MPNRITSPYDINNLFVAAAIKEDFTNTVSLSLDTSFFYRNMNVYITGAFVDFKDGQGYRNLSNVPTQKTYTDSSGRKPIVFKVTTSDGNTLYCNSSVMVTVTNNIANRYEDIDPLQANIEVPVVPADGISGGDFMQIRYAKSNPTRNQAQQHLRKPLIYVEGYDPSNKYDIYALIRNSPNIDNNGEWLKLIRDSYDFMNDLDDLAGYDLVFVNYNTFRSFEDNTKMLQRAIEWVNADKILGTGGTTTQNVVLGVSAGGVLARYTLARLTKFVSVNHADTRLLITMDSPHQGSNVPLSLQHFLYDLGEQKVLGQKIKDNDKDLKKFIELNNQPATAQLLKARVIDGNGTVVLNTFLNGPNSPYQQMVSYEPIYNPNNIIPLYKFLAVAQGSQCGVPVTSPSITFASQDAAFATFRFWFPPTPWTPFIHITSKWWLKCDMKALPDAGTANIESFKFERRIKLWGIGFGWKTLTDITRQNPAGFTAWDAAPGGTQSIEERTDGGLSTGLERQKLYKNWNGFPFIKLKAGASLNINQDAFSFVSTTSALDAPFGTDPNTIFNFAVNGNNNTSTFRYQAQAKELGSSLFNRNHTDYTPRNAKWIFNEMENISQTIDCNDQCFNYPGISGNGLICTSETYSVDNLPSGSTVVWSYLPNNGGLTFSINGNQIIYNKQLNGAYTITANVTTPCFSYSKSINIIAGANTIQTGVFSSPTYYFSPKPFGTWTNFSYTGPGSKIVLNMASGRSYYFDQLTVNGVPFYNYTNNQNGELIITYMLPVIIMGNVRSYNACGQYTSNVFYLNITNAGKLTENSIVSITPNPTTNFINVAFTDKNVADSKDSKTMGGNTVMDLVDLNSNITIKQWKFNEQNNKNYRLNIVGIKKGIYSLRIIRGENRYVEKIIIY